MTGREPKLYSELADWWPLVSTPADYAEAATRYAKLLIDACSPMRVLELGSGGGNNALHLQTRFEMTLVDLSPGMLEVSRALNPECNHHVGDMRDVRLGEEYDAVFIQDAVMHMASAEDVRLALETAFVHTRPGGSTLVAPDFVKETFQPGIDSGGHDGENRSLRYLGWIYDPDPEDATFEADYAFLMREGDAPTRIVHDHYTLGLFSRDEWLALCRDAGFNAEIRKVRHAMVGQQESEVLLCGRPG